MKPAQRPIGIELSLVAGHASRAFDEALAAAGGSRPTWLILMNLKQQPTANQRELAGKVGIRGATLTHHLNGMEAAGLLNRRRDPDNRRVHIVELSEAGHAMFFQLLGTVVEFDKRLCRGFEAPELELFRGLLGRIQANLLEDPA
ncbi:MAG: winged helix-turn-helix transcriptional regulator [Renibacterium sp.]|nr:winged helix-turn-helix transcriptional regulator [Renibacterium sp.]